MDILHVPSNGSDVTISTRFSANQIATAPDGVRGKVIPAAFLESVAYRDFAADVYTRLPESEALDAVYAAMPESLQNAHPQTTQERYAALCEIRAWLSEQAEYDLAPGKTPRNRDYVNFFLLENHKATACTSPPPAPFWHGTWEFPQLLRRVSGGQRSPEQCFYP